MRNMATFTMRIRRLFIVLAAIAVTCVSAGRDLRKLASTETENWVPQVPDAIKVPAGYKLHLNLFGEGYQYYRYNGSSWVQFSVKASLYDAEGKEIGQHFYLPHPDALGGQPSWKTQPSKGVPYSRVTAEAVAKISVDPKSIAWILLNATQVHGNKNYFGDVAYVQRYNTSAGLAPPSTSVAKIGRVRKSGYSAHYAFYVKE